MIQCTVGHVIPCFLKSPTSPIRGPVIAGVTITEHSVQFPNFSTDCFQTDDYVLPFGCAVHKDKIKYFFPDRTIFSYDSR